MSLLILEGARGAVDIDPSYYIYPMEGVERLYSANFGELRPDHFHSGIDIKSDGVEGKRVVAVADGYISRLGFSPYGYGLSLYITHPNGTTSVYGHLSRFRKDVEDRLREERYRTRQHSISLYFKPGEFPLKQGDLIAYSGNTGSSGGPHLHYEIRETATQRPINVIARGIVKPRDTRRPIMFKVHYMEVDTVDGVAYASPRRTYTTTNPEVGQYRLNVPQNEISVGRSGYFVAEVSDRKDDVTNTFGVHSFEGFVDGECYFKYRMDGFLFDQTRYVNVVSCYALKLDSRHEVIRMALPECGTAQFYETIVDRGVVSCEAGQRREVRMVATDDCGLQATLRFNIVGKEQTFRAEVDSTLSVIRAPRPFTFSGEGVRVDIPARSLYESMPFTFEKSTPKGDVVDSTVVVASPVYRILSDSIPLHKAMTLSIDVELSAEDQSRATIAKLSRSGKASRVGGEYKGGKISVETRSAGEFLVVVDHTPPTIKPNFVEGADLTSRSSLSVDVSDNFSGIKSYDAYIDGEWAAMDLHKGALTHRFVGQPSAGEHTLRVEVRDGVDNVTSMEIKFMR